MALWLCGHVAIWLCGYVAMWPCGHVALWLCGDVATWLGGSVAVWLGGYVAMWVCGYCELCAHPPPPVSGRPFMSWAQLIVQLLIISLLSPFWCILSEALQ